MLGVFSYFVGTDEMIIADQKKYFACESLGTNTATDCTALKSTSLDAFNVLSIVAIILQGLVSFVIFIFIVECKCKKRRRKPSQQLT